MKRVWTRRNESFVDTVPWVNLQRRRGKNRLLPTATVDSLKLKAHRTRVRTNEGITRTVRRHVVRVMNPRNESVGSVTGVSWRAVPFCYCCRSGGCFEKEKDEEEKDQDRTVHVSRRHCRFPPRKRERKRKGEIFLEKEKFKLERKREDIWWKQIGILMQHRRCTWIDVMKFFF